MTDPTNCDYTWRHDGIRHTCTGDHEGSTEITTYHPCGCGEYDYQRNKAGMQARRDRQMLWHRDHDDAT